LALSSCPFCSSQPDRLWIEGEHAVAVPDAHALTQGHTLIVPRKHVTTIYELTVPEQQGIWKLVAEVRERLLAALEPDGFNIGFNDGLAAGKTVEHAHVHVI
jgi:diadenosine tetraphosphate (Ap4A) HIT family hydrolase